MPYIRLPCAAEGILTPLLLQAVALILSPEIRKPFLAIFGAARFPHGIISHLIGAAGVAPMLVDVITVWRTRRR